MLDGEIDIESKRRKMSRFKLVAGLIKPEIIDYPEPEEVLVSVAAKEERILELVQEMRDLLEGKQK